MPLPAGLTDGSRLPEPIFTPAPRRRGASTTRTSRAELVDLVGAADAAELERITLAVYRRGADLAGQRGIIVADTKIELGFDAGGHSAAGRRGADPGLVPVLAGRLMAAGREPGAHSTSSSSGTG